MYKEFNYILDKIKNAEFNNIPFPHLHIKDFLSNEHLNLILNDKQIHFKEQNSNDELYNKLISMGWEIQKFPGCITSWDKYKTYLKQKYKNKHTDRKIQDIGITFRLQKYNNDDNKKLISFLNSDIFHNAIREKFCINEKTHIITAIQKNLRGYEITPHPDVRKKCMTYLVNINNNAALETDDHNTQLLEFKENYKYIQKRWENNPNEERAWVPWDYCNLVKTVNDNNSMIMFHPNSDPPTLHAIKLNYDHLKYQRTQIYGNLMYT